MRSLINFISYTLTYAKKSFGHPHMGWVERLRLFGVLMQLLVKAKYHPHRPVTQRGFGFTLYAPDPQLLLQLVLEIFVEGIYYFESEKAAPRIIDGGSNIGISVLYFKYLYPHAEILAIEPNPEAMVYLEKNIRENNLKGIRLIRAALWDQEGEETLYRAPSLLNASLIPYADREAFTVPTKKLSTYLRGNRIDLVKLDIEGAEEKVLSEIGNQGEIHNAKQYIIEFHPNASSPEGLEDLKQLLKGIGYTLQKSGSSSNLVNFLYKSPKFLPVY